MVVSIIEAEWLQNGLNSLDICDVPLPNPFPLPTNYRADVVAALEQAHGTQRWSGHFQCSYMRCSSGGAIMT